jgi:hypothetical protein
MPRIATEIGDGEYEWSSNPKDPGYIQDMEKYSTTLGILVMSLYFSFGLKFKMPKTADFPEDFNDFIALSFDPDNPYIKHHVRRKWAERMVSSNEELDVLYSLLQGRKMPTWEGVAESAKRFQSDSERVSDTVALDAEALSTN